MQFLRLLLHILSVKKFDISHKLDIHKTTRKQDKCLLFPILDLDTMNHEGTLLKLELF